MPRPEFAVHMLNDAGKVRAARIAERFESLLVELEGLIGPMGREMAIVRTKLEEGCFFAKKAMASQPQNQTTEPAPLDPKVQHLMDVYEALGIKWGDDPFSVIAKLKGGASA